MDKLRRELNNIWQYRVHISPDSLEGLPISFQRQHSVWDLAQAFMEVLAPLPERLLRWWLTLPRGHIIIQQGESRYAPGIQTWRSGQYESVLYVSAFQAAAEKQGSFLLVVQLLDSLLGSGARETNALFSGGCGATPELNSAAMHFARLAELGYGSEKLGTASAEDYLARTLYLACTLPQELNILNPLLLKLYRQSLLSETFWARQLKSR